MVELDAGRKCCAERSRGEPVMALPAEIDELRKGSERPHPVGRRRLQCDLAGGIDNKRRQRGPGIVLRWLRLPLGQRGASLGQTDRARLARAVDGFRDGEPDKGPPSSSAITSLSAAARASSSSTPAPASPPRRAVAAVNEGPSSLGSVPQDATRRSPASPIAGGSCRFPGRPTPLADGVASRASPRPKVDDACWLAFNPAQQSQPAFTQPGRLRTERAPTPSPGMRSGDDAPRARILVDGHDPFCQSERLQQLEVANRRAIFAPNQRRGATVRRSQRGGDSDASQTGVCGVETMRSKVRRSQATASG